MDAHAGNPFDANVWQSSLAAETQPPDVLFAATNSTDEDRIGNMSFDDLESFIQVYEHTPEGGGQAEDDSVDAAAEHLAALDVQNGVTADNEAPAESFHFPLVTPSETSSKEIMTALKEEGNRFVHGQRYQEAIQSYTAAIGHSPHPALFTNLALCHYKTNKYSKAIKDCNQALKLDPNWARAHQRKAESLIALHRHKEAEACAEEGLKLEEGNSKLHDSLLVLRDTARQESAFHVNHAHVTAMPTNQLTKWLEAASHANVSGMHLVKFSRLQGKKMRALEHEAHSETHRAITSYEACTAAGDTGSMAALGRIFLNGEGISEPDYKVGIHWYKCCIDHGPSEQSKLVTGGWDPEVHMAQGALGQAYRHGIGVEKDASCAENLLKLAAEGSTGSNGCCLDQNNYASLLSSIGLKEDAVKWYRIAVDAGYPLAMSNLGERLLHGQGTAKNLEVFCILLSRCND